MVLQAISDRRWCCSLLLALLVVELKLQLASSQDIHHCVHDQLNADIQSAPLDNVVGERRKRQAVEYEPIRITPHLIQDSITGVPGAVFAAGGPLSQAVALLSEALSVHRVQGKFRIQPALTSCSTTFACGGGTCSCDSASTTLAPRTCGDLVTIPDEHIGTVPACNVSVSQCGSVGPNGDGLDDTDFVLYITAIQTDRCNISVNTRAYASACVVDPDANSIPRAGFVNLCSQNIDGIDNSQLKRVFAHEMLHALAFSTALFPLYGTQPTLGEQMYNGANRRAVVTSIVVEHAKGYYECDTLGGVFIEQFNSHWDSRILLPELMSPTLYSVYSVLSEFTLALLEDSGWYQANYTVANRTVNDEPIPLLYGKGLGCPFVFDDCTNAESYPYACSPIGFFLNWCSFDGIHKSVCRQINADGCQIPLPVGGIEPDCRSPTAFIQDSSLELAGDQSLCFRSSFYTASTPNQPLSELTASCYKVHPIFDGTDHRYAVETAADTAATIPQLDYRCSSDGEMINATSGSAILGGSLRCGSLTNVLTFLSDNVALVCHSSCLTCSRTNDSTACTSCSDSTHVVIGGPEGPCQPCGFGTYLQRSVCVVSCDDGLIGDSNTRVCRDVQATDFNLDGYTVNATKYEAVISADEHTGMILGGSYLFTIRVITDDTLDINEVDVFFTSISQNGVRSIDFGAVPGILPELIVVRTINPLPEGVYRFSISLVPFSSMGVLNPVDTQVNEAEVRIQPPPNLCDNEPCQNNGTCSQITINNQLTFSCACAPGWTGLTCADDIDECVPDPCQNGGQCINMQNAYMCVCSANFMGVNCEEDRNECVAFAPCQNGGNCSNTFGDYVCTCPDTWMGKNCEEDVDECTTDDPCVNGDCTNTAGGYSCACDSGWTGMNCDGDINECIPEPGPCQNGGTCNNAIGGYNCSCPVQWTGMNCDEDINECAFFPCQNGGTCNNTDGDYMCLCLETWTGKDCEDDVDECTTDDPCVNGDCTNTAGGYNCTCDSGWTGMNCDVDINECIPEPGPCVNGGTCNNAIGGYNCSCPVQWTGTNCDVDVDECLNDPCLNEGICNNTIGDYMCLCPEEWTGKDCEVDVDECTTNDPCVNGDCTNTAGGYSCACDSGWTGVNCEEDINDCAFFPCQNGGTCNNTLGSFSCNCPPQWTGRRCETDVNECSNDPCVNGNCVNIQGNFVCICNEGWTDPLCDADVDECDQMPPRCENNGTCINTVGGFNCTCLPGFSGSTCSEDSRDPCSGMPCQNGNCTQLSSTSYFCMCDPDYTGMLQCTVIDNCMNVTCGNGSCVDGVNSYMCDCDEGFEGANCEIDINECDPNPCQQGANCIDLINDYMCVCPDGYSGKDCETDINLCDPNPCENRGTCNGTTSYTCECVEPFIGTNCSERRNLCEPDTCSFNGDCTSDGFTFTCACFENYYGDNCEFFNLCTSNPCQNEGICTALNDTMGYSCDCPFPFSGQNCTVVIDPCVADDPCVNGNCNSAGQGSYSCVCNPGWTGMNCDVDIMDCAMNPCVNGECMEAPGSYNCSCYQGWEGRHCDQDIDYCFPNHMCQNNGSCVDGNSTFTCDCSHVDYEGALCDVPINDCMPSPCLNSGTCFDGVRDYVCFCEDEYIGDNCEIFAGDCVVVLPCQNGGTCEVTNGRNECVCPPGLMGYFCQDDINECSASNPCNSGTCNNTFGSFFCSCPAGYAGMLCTIINCDGNPCQNGQCMIDQAENTNFTCICNSGYTGNLCEVDVNECLSSPCVVGNCTNTQGSFTCDCPPNYTGSLCETEVNFCLNVNCGNGVCMNLSDMYVCVCSPGYTGANCGDNINDCVNITCSGNGNCIDLIDNFQCMCNLGYTGPLCADTYNVCADNLCNANGTANCRDDQLNEGFICECQPGYTGPLCDTLISHCAMMQNSCFNNGTCRDIVNGFTCDCLPGFSGNRCEFIIDECASQPCENFGTCVDGTNSFTCFCTDAWDGSRCEIYVFSGLCADLSPCANGGRCMDTIDSYECDCIGDYTGENCTVQVDHCNQNPCQANATCVDGVQTYICICPPGYTGRDCENFRGTPYNCTDDSDCGFGFFCQRSCPTDGYPQHETLLKEPLTLVGESSLFVPINRYPTLMINSTLIARFRQDPNNPGYIFYHSSDAVTHTYGILLNASSSEVKVLYQSRSNGTRAIAVITSQYRWNDNAYHTLAVSVNEAGNGTFDVVVIMDGFYIGYALLDIDFSFRVGMDDPVFIVGSRLPLPGNFRFVGRIIQVAVFENALSREEVVELMVVFNHLSGVNGTCIPDLKEGDRCPIPVTASSSLCDTTTERCNPAERCLPNVLGEFECRNAPIECESDSECVAALLGPAICGSFEFPRYGRNFYEKSDSRIVGMLQYLQREPMVFDFNTQPRFIPSNEYPNVTKDLTIFAAVEQELDNNGYVVAKESSSSNRDYGLYLASRDNFIVLLYRTVNGTFHRFFFSNVSVAGMGPSTVAAIVDSEKGRAELFINGTSVGRRRLEREPQFQPELHLLAVGGRPDNSVYNFRGTVSDLLVTNVALPYDVIQSMSSASLTGRFEPSTVSRYCFLLAESGSYCHANSRTDNNFKCVDNAACLAGPSAPQAPVLPEPFDQFGPIGFCQ